MAIIHFMSNRTVTYKNTLLAKNSEAYKLWEDVEFAKLDKHLKQLDKNQQELLKRYENAK